MLEPHLLSTCNQLWLSSPDFSETIEKLPLSSDEIQLIETFRQQGYVVIESGISDEHIATTVNELQGKYTDAASGHTEPSRVLDAWEFNPQVKAIAGAPEVLKTLELLYQRRPIPFQTLNFMYGTQQAAHSDLIHFNSEPLGFMCGAWVAFEATDSGNGPLFYYEGSHRLPYYDYFSLGIKPGDKDSYRQYEDKICELIRQHGLIKKQLHLKKGQCVIWAANLLHGGSPITETGRTRYSQVTHYYFENCYYYQPGYSDPQLGRFALKDITNLATGEKVPHTYRGRTIKASDFGPGFWEKTFPRLSHHVKAAQNRSLSETWGRLGRKVKRRLASQN